MGATIERSLYIALYRHIKDKVRFFDDIKLKLKNGQIVEGEIVDLDENTVTIQSSGGTCYPIYVDDIEGYINI